MNTKLKISFIFCNLRWKVDDDNHAHYTMEIDVFFQRLNSMESNERKK